MFCKKGIIALPAGPNRPDLVIEFLFRLMQEAKATLSRHKRKILIEALFALALAEGKMTAPGIEEIRNIAYGLDCTHREFINAKPRVLGRDQTSR